MKRKKSPKLAERRGETALITGATSGIGYEFAKLLAAKGYDLVLVGRDRDRLPKIAQMLHRRYKIEVQTIRKDLTEARAADEIFAELRVAKQPIEILINSAGVGSYGEFVETSLLTTQKLLQLNMLAPTRLTRLLLPAMVKRGHGRVLNVASTASFVPGPMMATYYASKHYLRAFSEGIAQELSASEADITVTALCPGPTKSGFWKNAQATRSKLAHQPLMSATSVARIGYRGLMHGKRVVIPGWRNRLIVLGARLIPSRTQARLVYNASKLRGYK